MTNIDLILKEACRIAELNLAEQDCARVSEMPDIETSENFDRRVKELFPSHKDGESQKNVY